MFKKFEITLSQKCFPGSYFDTVRTSFLKFQQQNLHGQKFTEWKTALIPQHLIGRMFLLYSAVITF